MRRRSNACRCGGDMPGICPGPANCPMCEPPKPACAKCGSEYDVRDAYNDIADEPWFLCGDCLDDELQDRAERAAEGAA